MATGQVILSAWLFSACGVVDVSWWALTCNIKIFPLPADAHASIPDLLGPARSVFLILDS